jgi:hypothetical protein
VSIVAMRRTRLADLLQRHPIAAWASGGGTGGTTYFRYDDRNFSTTFDLPAHLKPAATDLVREIAEWRLAKYLRRAGGEVPSNTAAAAELRFVCKVSHANGRPILFLPDRDRTAGVPTGWTRVRVDGETYEANFVKIAVNVMRRPGSSVNLLSSVLRAWFGESAGLAGTMHAVQWWRDWDGWVMAPILAETAGAEVPST